VNRSARRLPFVCNRKRRSGGGNGRDQMMTSCAYERDRTVHICRQTLVVNSERDRIDHLLQFLLAWAYRPCLSVGGADQMARKEPKKGRPDLQGSMELDAHLMATAAKLFIEQGYEGTSMGQIVAAAGAGKQSLYRRYANKDVLFKEVFTNFVMKNIIARSVEHLTSFAHEGCLDEKDGLVTLHKIARQSFNFMLERETVETFRLFVAERSRFPELNQQVRRMIQYIEDEITRHIRRAQEYGLIRTDIDRDISRSFMALINEGPLIQALLELPSLENAEGRERYFDSAWKAFIDSVAVRP
jgi:AcrR family transcriptional regulator